VQTCVPQDTPCWPPVKRRDQFVGSIGRFSAQKLLRSVPRRQPFIGPEAARDLSAAAAAADPNPEMVVRRISPADEYQPIPRRVGSFE
jgi:hypothetical protein